MSEFGLRPIPAADLAQITAPTSLIRGRHDLQTPLRVAEAASSRYGWPFARDRRSDDPFFEQPAAALRALHAELPLSPDKKRSPSLDDAGVKLEGVRAGDQWVGDPPSILELGSGSRQP